MIRYLNISIPLILAVVIGRQTDPMGEQLIHGYQGLSWATMALIWLAMANVTVFGRKD